MQAYKGYVENGHFYPIDQIMRSSKRVNAVVTLLDEETSLPVRPPFQYGSMLGRVWMSDDFDAPLEDFKEYME